MQAQEKRTMASILNPTLSLGSSIGDKRNVTVAASLKFSASDVGRTYKLEIQLFGEDKSGDALPSGDAVGDDKIYTYAWPGPVLPRPYKMITVAAAGTVALSETRAVSNEALDEDPGKVVIGKADIHTPVFMPRSDEVYARVTLGVASVSARTPTVQAGIGV
jgi:hypothetical protein